MPLRPENLLRAIYDHLPNPVIVGDRNREIISVNAAFTRQFGYEAEQVMGKKALMLYADPEDFHKQGRTRFNIKKLTGKGSAAISYRRKDGSVFPSDTIGSQITDNDGHILGFLAIIHDISSIIEQDQQRRRLEQILDDALNTMPEGYVVYDEDDRLILCNQSYRDLYDKCAPAMEPGATFEQVLRYGMAHGQFPSAGNTTESQEEFIKNRLAYHREPTGSVIRQIGPRRWMKIEDKITRHGYRVGIRTDVSDLKRTQDELRDMNVELERKNAALRQFAGIVSHDLQAPLRHIAMFAGMLTQADNSEEEKRDITARVLSTARRMQQMIVSLLEYSKVAYREVEMMPLNARTLVDEALRVLEVNVEEAGARLKIEPLPPVTGDSELLILLFRNLLSNALKYRSDRPLQIIVSGKQRGAMAEFSVTDNGIGIDPQYSDRIFQLFKRLHSNESQFQGTGIGLTLCQRIVESHGGKIWLDTSYAGGARFLFTLPGKR